MYGFVLLSLLWSCCLVDVYEFVVLLMFPFEATRVPFGGMRVPFGSNCAGIVTRVRGYIHIHMAKK